MSFVFTLAFHSPRRHNVSRRIDPSSRSHGIGENFFIRREVKGVQRDRTALRFQQAPSIDAVEELEENRSEKEVARVLRPSELHFADEELADPVRSPIGIGEAVAHENWI